MNYSIKILLSGIAVYFFLQYLFPYISPFLFSFCIVYLLYPRLEKLQKQLRVKKEVLLIGILTMVILLVLLFLWLLLQFGTVQMGNLTQNWEGISTTVNGRIRIFFEDCCLFVERHFGVNADRVERVILDRIDILAEEVRVELVPRLMTESWWYARKLLSVAAFLGIAMVASVLLCKDYEAIVDTACRLGGASTDKIMIALHHILHMVAVFLKTQGIIMLIVAGISSVGFVIGKIKYPIALGFLTGLMDALPFIGTGIVLVPTALWQIICGRYGAAVWCLIVYVICIMARELLEPRLMGEKIGIYPIFILFSVYTGVKLFGVSGILKGPLGLVVLMEFLRKDQQDEEKESR